MLVPSIDDLTVECEDGPKTITPSDILVFCTGASREPPLGFPKQGELTFTHRAEDKYATASTCDLHLTLPVITSYCAFKEMMQDSLLLCDGFGYA